MLQRWSGRTALVTGASSGIGAAIADAVLYMLSTRPQIQMQDILLSPLGQGL